MKKLLLLALISLLPFHSIAATEGDTYFSFGYGLGTYSEDGFPDTNPGALIVRFGQHTGDGFAIEGRFGIGIGDDSFTTRVQGVDVDLAIEVDTIIGVYGLKHFGNIDKGTSVYGVLGFTRGELTATGSASAFGTSFSESISDSSSSLSLGVGLQINQFNIEFMRYFDDFTAIGVGVAF
jgi:opacity protein-like surface antigen